MVVSRGVTQNSTNTYYLVLGTSWEASFPRANKTWVQKDGLIIKKKDSRCVGIRMLYGAHRHTHTFIHGLPNQALRTARLSVTIWKNFLRNRRARFGGLGSVLSVPWKSASFGSDSGGLPKAEVASVGVEFTWVDGVGGL